MGPGSESMAFQYNSQQQHPSVKNIKKSSNNNNNNKSKGSWFYDEAKSTVEGGKPQGKSAKKQTIINQTNTSHQSQYHAKSKPIPVKRSNSHSNEAGGKVARSHPGGKHHASRHSPVKGVVTTQRPNCLTPTNMTSTSPITVSSSPLKGTPGKNFYAGAKFETNPSCMVLPPPPSHWTTSAERSQSQPSTPTIKSALNGTQFTSIDLASLFGSPTNPVTMAKSFPGVSAAGIKRMDSESSDEEMKDGSNGGTKTVIAKKEAVPSVTTASPRRAVNTNDLKKALGMVAANVMESGESGMELTCQGSLTPLNSFKEMSDQLKSLMKVAA